MAVLRIPLQITINIILGLPPIDLSIRNLAMSSIINFIRAQYIKMRGYVHSSFGINLNFDTKVHPTGTLSGNFL